MSKLTKTIKAQVGNGGKKYCKYAGLSTSENWCAAFVWWCLKKCGVDYQYMRKADNPFYVPNIEAWAKKHGRVIKKSKARQGDIITFDWEPNGRGNHVGFFWSGDPNGTFKTIEGNTGSPYASKAKVMMRTRYSYQVCKVIRLKKVKSTDTAAKTTEVKKDTTKEEKTLGTPISATYKVLQNMGMNVRKEPRTTSERIGGLPYLTKVKATRKYENWVYVPSCKGWVCTGADGKTYMKKVE